MQVICQATQAIKVKNAAPKGRINSEWIAELFLQMLFIINTNSIAAKLTAGLYLPAQAWLEPPDLELVPC